MNGGHSLVGVGGERYPLTLLPRLSKHCNVFKYVMKFIHYCESKVVKGRVADVRTPIVGPRLCEATLCSECIGEVGEECPCCQKYYCKVCKAQNPEWNIKCPKRNI